MTGIDYDRLLSYNHCSIHSTTILIKPRDEKVVRSSRKIRHANINGLASMMESVLPAMDSLGSDVSRLVEEYNAKKKVVIDKVAPFVTKSYIVKPCMPWINASHLDKRRCVCYLERKF